MATNVNGKEVLRASLGLLRQDRQMVWLPVLSAMGATVAFLIVAAPLGLALSSTRVGVLVALFCGSVVANCVAVYFNVALVFAANERIEGRAPTLGGVLAMAWARKGVIVQWAVLAAVVGTILRAVEDRLGIFGRVVAVLGSLAWAVATFLVLPVLAFEEVTPLQAVKRSSEVLKTRFGTVARSGLRFGFLFLGWTLLAGAVIAVGVMSAATLPFLGVPIALVGVVALVFVALYASAATVYMRTVLYRYATDQPVPSLGVDLSRTFG